MYQVVVILDFSCIVCFYFGEGLISSRVLFVFLFVFLFYCLYSISKSDFCEWQLV